MNKLLTKEVLIEPGFIRKGQKMSELMLHASGILGATTLFGHHGDRVIRCLTFVKS
jgi:hypothetical protein